MKHLWFAAALLFPTVAQAQQFSVAIDESPTFSFDLNARLSSVEFSHQLRVPLTPDDIRSADLLSAVGDPIQFRMLADKKTGLIIGTPTDDLQIELMKRINDAGEVKYVVVGRRNGKFHHLTEQDLFLTDLRFGDFCFNLEPLDEAGLPMVVEVAVDVSGSMQNTAQDMRSSLHTFFSKLPKSATCSTTLFNDTYWPLLPNSSSFPDGRYACEAFADRELLQTKLIPDGGTDIVSPLTAMYQRLEQSPESVNLALVVSDGMGSANRASPEFIRLRSLRNQVVAQNKAYTIVLWRGDYRQDYPLGDLADASIIGPLSDADAISTFFEQSKELLEAHSVVTPVQCG